MIDSSTYFHSFVTKTDPLLYDRSVVCIFIQLWLKSTGCYMIDQYSVYFHSVVTKIDQLFDWSV